MPAQPNAAQEVTAVTRTYDFLLWLMPITADFPRAHRYTLGTRLEEGALDLLDLLVKASYTREKMELLRSANRRLERLRNTSRALTMRS